MMRKKKSEKVVTIVSNQPGYLCEVRNCGKDATNVYKGHKLCYKCYVEYKALIEKKN